MTARTSAYARRVHAAPLVHAPPDTVDALAGRAPTAYRVPLADRGACEAALHDPLSGASRSGPAGQKSPHRVVSPVSLDG